MSVTTYELDEQIYQFFIEESLEFLQILESGLLDLRHDRSVIIHSPLKESKQLGLVV